MPFMKQKLATREEIERLAEQFRGNERFERWKKCGPHDLQALPVTVWGTLRSELLRTLEF
jgi:hypothetical protein